MDSDDLVEPLYRAHLSLGFCASNFARTFIKGYSALMRNRLGALQHKESPECPCGKRKPRPVSIVDQSADELRTAS